MCKTGLAILGHGKFSTIMNLIHEWAGMPPMFVGQAKDAAERRARDKMEEKRREQREADSK